MLEVFHLALHTNPPCFSTLHFACPSRTACTTSTKLPCPLSSSWIWLIVSPYKILERWRLVWPRDFFLHLLSTSMTWADGWFSQLSIITSFPVASSVSPSSEFPSLILFSTPLGQDMVISLLLQAPGYYTHPTFHFHFCNHFLCK